MFATSSTLLPFAIAKAETEKPWECTPSADFRSWVCLKDGKAPEEKVSKPLAAQPEKASEASGVTVTPLAAPETVQPVLIAEIRTKVSSFFFGLLLCR